MSHDLSPLGFRKTPFTRELTVRERFPLDPQAQVAAAPHRGGAGAHERRPHRSRRHRQDRRLAHCCPPSESSWFCTTPPGGVG